MKWREAGSHPGRGMYPEGAGRKGFPGVAGGACVRRRSPLPKGLFFPGLGGGEREEENPLTVGVGATLRLAILRRRTSGRASPGSSGAGPPCPWPPSRALELRAGG